MKTVFLLADKEPSYRDRTKKGAVITQSVELSQRGNTVTEGQHCHWGNFWEWGTVLASSAELSSLAYLYYVIIFSFAVLVCLCMHVLDSFNPYTLQARVMPMCLCVWGWGGGGGGQGGSLI